MNLVSKETRRMKHQQACTGNLKMAIDPVEEETGALARVLEKVDQAVDRLPRQVRAAILLHYFEGRDQREVARTLGMSYAKVRTLLSRGRDKLREAMAREGYAVTGVAVMQVLTEIGSRRPPAEVLERIWEAVRAHLWAGAAASAGVAETVDAVHRILRWIAIKKAAVVTAAVLAVGGAGAVGGRALLKRAASSRNRAGPRPAPVAGGAEAGGVTAWPAPAERPVWTVRSKANKTWNHVAVDAAGNAYVAGAPGRGEGTVCKYDRAGRELWRRSVSGRIEGLARAGPRGGVYVLLGPAGGKPVQEPLALMDGSGEWVWKRQMSKGPAASGAATGVAVDARGRAYVAGEARNDGSLTLWAFDRDGRCVYAVRPRLTGDTCVHRALIAAGADGSVAVACRRTRRDRAERKIRVYRFDGRGVQQGSLLVDDPTEKVAVNGLALDGAGGVYLTGRVQEAASPFAGAIWTAKYDAAGRVVWRRRHAGPGRNRKGLEHQAGLGIVVTGDGGAIVVGAEACDRLQPDRAEMIDTQVWLRRYDSAGAAVWTRVWDGPGQKMRGYLDGYDTGCAMDVGGDGAIVVSGRSGGQAWLGRWDATGAAGEPSP
jgi:hypothetical protein